MKPTSRAKIRALEELRSEAQYLTHRLRTAGEQIHGSQSLPAGLRSLLEDLRQHGPQTVPQLALTNSVSRQHIQASVNRLLADRLVELEPNPAHRRSSLLRITGEGERLLQAMKEREEMLLTRLPTPLTKKQLRSATATLRAVRDLFEGRDWERLISE